MGKATEKAKQVSRKNAAPVVSFTTAQRKAINDYARNVVESESQHIGRVVAYLHIIGGFSTPHTPETLAERERAVETAMTKAVIDGMVKRYGEGRREKAGATARNYRMRVRTSVLLLKAANVTDIEKAPADVMAMLSDVGRGDLTVGQATAITEKAATLKSGSKASRVVKAAATLKADKEKAKGQAKKKAVTKPGAVSKVAAFDGWLAEGATIRAAIAKGDAQVSAKAFSAWETLAADLTATLATLAAKAKA